VHNALLEKKSQVAAQSMEQTAIQRLNVLLDRFAEIKSKIAIRDEVRSKMDYEALQVDKARTNKEKLGAKGQKESPKEEETRRKHENQLALLTKEYEDHNTALIQQISDFWDKRFDLLGPVLSDFLTAEKIFSHSLSESVRELDPIVSSTPKPEKSWDELLASAVSWKPNSHSTISPTSSSTSMYDPLPSFSSPSNSSFSSPQSFSSLPPTRSSSGSTSTVPILPTSAPPMRATSVPTYTSENNIDVQSSPPKYTKPPRPQKVTSQSNLSETPSMPVTAPPSTYVPSYPTTTPSYSVPTSTYTPTYLPPTGSTSYTSNNPTPSVEDAKKTYAFYKDNEQDIKRGAQFAQAHEKEVKAGVKWAQQNPETAKKAANVFGSLVKTTSSKG